MCYFTEQLVWAGMFLGTPNFVLVDILEAAEAFCIIKILYCRERTCCVCIRWYCAHDLFLVSRIQSGLV